MTAIEKQKTEDLIKKFIENNGLDFDEGRRNNDSVIIIGYFLYITKNYKRVSYLHLFNILLRMKPEFRSFEEEFIKIYNYANDNDYKSWWEDKDNTKEYII